MTTLFKRLLLLALLPLSACTKVMVYASDHPTEAVSKSFAGDPNYVFEKCARTLEGLGFETASRDDSQYQIVTGWRPVMSGSHYLNIFGRRDYSAANGSYYQMTVTVASEGAFARVDVKTTVKTVSGRLASSRDLERRFLARLEDVLRSPQIQITNVGVENR